MHGDLLRQDDVDAIVNTVNCVGVMGKGIALQFKNKWPANFRGYAAACKAGEVRPGRMFVHDSGGLVKPNYIINFPTKDHWRGKSRIEFIRDGLDDLVDRVRKLGIRSIAIPPLGCGNGGLEWSRVRPMIEQAFSALPDVEVRLFEPGETPDPRAMEVNTERPRMTPGRAAILKAIETYRALDYGLSRVEVQKLAYFLQEAGQPLDLKFEKHLYGPYSDALRHALQRMEGHFVRGVGDGVVESEIAPISEALVEAERFIEEAGHEALNERIGRIASLIEGFQSPYGMELLATVHWVCSREGARDADEALSRIRDWNDRKKSLMSSDHVQIAWQQLQSAGWLNNIPTQPLPLAEVKYRTAS